MNNENSVSSNKYVYLLSIECGSSSENNNTYFSLAHHFSAHMHFRARYVGGPRKMITQLARKPESELCGLRIGSNGNFQLLCGSDLVQIWFCIASDVDESI